MGEVRHEPLLRELHVALLGEIGAREIYLRLAGWAQSSELESVLCGLHQDECELVEKVATLMESLGRRPRRWSLRRTGLARLLALSAPLIGTRFALRICEDAEDTRARWYGHFQEYLLAAGEQTAAQSCAQLQLVKLRHARVLQTWLLNAPRRS